MLSIYNYKIQGITIRAVDITFNEKVKLLEQLMHCNF
jgi:hypothetical protein